METINITKDFLLNLDDTRKSKLREKIANKEISLNVTDNPTSKDETPTEPSYNDIGEVHAAPVPTGNVEDKTLWDKTKDFVKDGVDEAKRFLHMGADGLETGVNAINPAIAITGELDIVDDTPMKKELNQKLDENKIEDSLIQDIQAIARTDIRLMGEATKEQKDMLTTNISNVLHRGGYDLGQKKDGSLIAIDEEGNHKEITNGFFENIVNGIVSDAGEISGAMYGAYKGAKIAKQVPNIYAKAGTVLASSAIGAVTGTALDTAVSELKGNQNLSIEDYLNELSKSAVLDVAGNAIGYGVIKVGGKVIDAPKALYDYVGNGNINGAKKLLKDKYNVTDEEIPEILENAKKNIQEDYTKGLTNIGKQQEELLSVVQTDKKFGSELIHDIVLDNKDVAEEVAKTIDKRTKDLIGVPEHKDPRGNTIDKKIGTFDDLKIDGTDVKKSVRNYEQQVHDQYGNMLKSFEDAFKETDYSFDLDSLKIEETMKKFLPDIVDENYKNTAENLILKVENTIQNAGANSGKTRDINELLKVRKSANHFYDILKKNLDSDGLKLYRAVKKNIDNELERAVKESLPENMHKPMMDTFTNALSEYTQMFNIRDTKLYKTLTDDGLNANTRMDNLIKHTADDEKEFETLLKKLPYENQQMTENSIVSSFLEKYKIGKSHELQVVDYTKVAEGLESLEKFFITDSGKDSIQLMKDMAVKYGDDIDLLKAATQAGVDTNAGIATSIKGRIEYKIAKNSFDRIMRLIPFSNTSKRLALQKHISTALEKSRTPVELAKKVLVAPDLPAATKNDLREIIADNNKMLKLKNDKEAIELQKELESKILLKQQKEQAIQDEIENFKTPNTDEANAVEQLTSSDKYGSFSHVVREVQGENPSSVSIEKYVKAKHDIDQKVLDSFILESKYPINKSMIERFEKLKSFDKSKVSDVVTDNEFKSLIYHLKKDTVPGTTEKLQSKYKEKFYKLNKLFDELEEEIEYKYAVDNDLVPFANGKLLGGAFAGGSDASINQRDINNDGISNEEDIALGAMMGVLGTQALSKMFPKMFQTTGDNIVGSFAGKSPVIKEFKDTHGFYSVLEKVIDTKVGGKIDSVSLTKMLEKNGVKKDELEWSGLKELMEKNTKLTKEQIETNINENRLVIEVLEQTDSKWHKTAPKEKYQLPNAKEYRELLFTMPSDSKSFKSEHFEESNILTFTRVDDRIIDNKKTLFIEELQSDWHQEGRKKGYGTKKIPDAPFKKNWTELGIKRMMQEAVSKDYEKLAWTTGTQQAKRYSLEKQVDMIVYNKENGFLVGTNNGEEEVFKKVASDEEVEALMGKELTKRLINPKSTTRENIYVLQGDELKFGGDGMKTYYDKIVPNAVKKLFNKYNVKPKMEEIEELEEMVWTVDITKEMKEDIKKYGQPLYAIGGSIVGLEAINNGDTE